MRQRHLLVGNWKMNLGPRAAATYARQLRENLPELTKTDVWISPPHISLPAVTSELQGCPISVGAQNVHFAESGAYTGETSPAFLCELGVPFTLVGHSERRIYFGETNELVAKRTTGALSNGLTAIVCIGESESERECGKTEAVLFNQLTPVLSCLTQTSAHLVVIAYEPCWAIGTGKVASIEEIASAHAYISSVWNGYNFGTSAVTLYGGSVNPTNFASILALPQVHGALVGGASLKIDQWNELISIAEKTPIAR